MSTRGQKYVQSFLPTHAPEQRVVIERRTVYGIGDVEIIATIEDQGFSLEQRTANATCIIPLVSIQAIENLMAFCLNYRRDHIPMKNTSRQ